MELLALVAVALAFAGVVAVSLIAVAVGTRGAEPTSTDGGVDQAEMYQAGFE